MSIAPEVYAHGSLEYLPVRVSRRDDDGALTDPTALTVQMSATPQTTPPTEPATLYTAAWVTSGDSSDPDRAMYKARFLIGPGSTIGELAPGAYDAWVKITASPEIPLLRAPVGFIVE